VARERVRARGRLLLVVANLAKDTPADARISLCPVRQDVPVTSRVRACLDWHGTAVKANGLSVPCEAMGWKLIEVN